MSEQSSTTAANQIAELKVSGHLMTLEPGLYCVFGAPGGVAPDASSGLPVVRISAGPGVQAGRVKLVGMEADGWIGPDSATLVRVTEARSEVLVTVYQALDSRSDAPAIQVVRIAGSHDAAASQGQKLQPAQPADPAVAKVEVIGHVYGRGDVGGPLGEWMGERGSKRWIEGFGIAPIAGIPLADLEYQAVLGRGWLSPWSEGGQFCGSRGMSLPILGLRVRLRGASATTHRVVLSASFVDGTEVGPVGDGEACEAPSLAALEAFELSIVPIGARAASVKLSPTAKASPKADAKKPATAPAKASAKAAPAKKSPAKAKAPAPQAAPPTVAAAAPSPRAKRNAPAPRRR
jgi:hypothetical protein